MVRVAVAPGPPGSGPVREALSLVASGEAREKLVRGSRLLTGAVALALGAVSLAACSGSGSGSGSNAITLYSGQHVQTTQALVAAFETEDGDHRQRPI